MDFTEKSYKSFEIFNKQWALVTAGNINDFNTCTVGWGEMGTLWNHRPVITVFIHPSRYTSEFLKKYDDFTVSFYDEKYRKALGYLGSHSGRNEDKVSASGLTPVSCADAVTFKEAQLTFLCHKIYFHQMSKDGMSEEVKKYYAASPTKYPKVHEDGTDDLWEPHYAIVGEVVKAIENSSLQQHE